MITERTLKKWRGEALEEVSEPVPSNIESFNVVLSKYIEINERILRLTQVLLDQHLLHNARFRGVKK